MDPRAMRVVGTIGDVNPVDYGGGVVLEDGVGVCSVEWYEPLDEDDDGSDVWVYRVDIDHGVEDWMELNAVARTSGLDVAELTAGFDSKDPVTRARAWWTLACHYGWHELDSYPDRLTYAEAEARLAAVEG